MSSQEPAPPFSFNDLGFETSVACIDDALGFDDFVTHGVNARAAGDHNGALAAFIKASDLEPAHRGVQLEMALTLTDLDRFEDAEHIYRKIISIDQHCSPALAGMGHIERRRANHHQAAEWFASAASAEPSDLNTQSELAAELRNLGKFDESDALYCDILDRDPEHFGGLTGLAIAFRRRGRRSEALAIFLGLLETKPAHVGLLHEAARTMIEMADFSQAAVIYRRILEIAPDDPHAMLGLGRAAQWSGAVSEALEFFRAAVLAQPHSVTPNLELAKFLRKSNRLEEARDILVQALREHPSDSALLLEVTNLSNALNA